MREFAECKAEIFRRMDEGNKKRKKRRDRVLMCSAALCLCLAIGAAATFPGMGPAYTEEAAAYLRVEITDKNEACYTTEDAETADQIYSLVQAAFAGSPNDDEYAGTAGNAPVGDAECEIAFFFDDGEKTVYLITESTIINQTTNEQKKLTQLEYHALMESIGALINGKENAK